jgi:gamma-glutamyltranspeptidase/glutathione hydrolase
VLRPGDPLQRQPLLADPAGRLGLGPGGPSTDTTTCLTADAAGNVVAATPSGWSGVLAGNTGIWLGSRLQSFNLADGHPNVIAPGKRPRITLTPTLVLKDGRPQFAVSIAGGDLQDQASLQVLLNLIDFQMDPAAAVTAPRFSTAHHVGSFGQTPPELGSLQLDDRFAPATAQALRDLGHRVKLVPPAVAAPTALRIDPSTGRIEAAGDPRAGRHAGAL